MIYNVCVYSSIPYHNELLHRTIDDISDDLGHGLTHLVPDLKLHVHVSVVKQVEESQPLPVEFLNRARIPPVLVELAVGIHRQLSQRVREGLEQQEDEQHDLEDHRHLELQIELQKGRLGVRTDHRDDILRHNEVLHELYTKS